MTPWSDGGGQRVRMACQNLLRNLRTVYPPGSPSPLSSYAAAVSQIDAIRIRLQRLTATGLDPFFWSDTYFKIVVCAKFTVHVISFIRKQIFGRFSLARARVYIYLTKIGRNCSNAKKVAGRKTAMAGRRPPTSWGPCQNPLARFCYGLTDGNGIFAVRGRRSPEPTYRPDREMSATACRAAP